jgi:hypothetical protein
VAGIGMHLGAIQTDHPQFQHTCLLGQQEHLRLRLVEVGAGDERAEVTFYSDPGPSG